MSVSAILPWLNVGRHDMMNAVKAVNDGTAVGVYRDRDKKVPVLLHG